MARNTATPFEAPMFTRILGGVLFATLVPTPSTVPALADASPKRKVTVVFDHVLPNVPGKSMKGVLVEYGPGGSSRSHRHPASAFIYATVLEGAIRNQVNDGPVKVYRAGENWVELPGDHHRVELAGAGRLVQRLEAAGIDLASVTDVVLTHLHMDHIGGLLVTGVRGRLRPDLRIHVAAAETEFWTPWSDSDGWEWQRSLHLRIAHAHVAPSINGGLEAWEIPT